MTEAKRFNQLPDFDGLSEKWLGAYDQSNYSGTMSSLVLKSTHSLIEQPFQNMHHFDTVLEIGAGTLAHLPFVRHGFSRYIASDHDLRIVEALSGTNLPVGVEVCHIDGRELPFADGSVDRIIATHVLEHVPAPHLAIEEWVRVLRPGGVLSLILPCDPGLLWRFGRLFGPRRRAVAAGLPYDYYMAREHINSIHNLSVILQYHFPKRHTTWWPTRIPLPDMNLIYAGNFYV